MKEKNTQHSKLFFNAVYFFVIKKLFQAILRMIQIERRIQHMGRDNKQGKSKNKNSLPQTPKNEKIAPNAAKEETAQELLELESLVAKNKQKNKQK